MDIYREILQYLHYHPQSSRDEIARGTAFEGSDATMKRLIATAVTQGDVVVEGKARATRYRLSDQAYLLMPLNLDTYFAQDVDERQVQTSFNFELIRKQLPAVHLFTDEEMAHFGRTSGRIQSACERNDGKRVSQGDGASGYRLELEIVTD